MALDGVIAGVNRVEEDPEDITVGYAAFPNQRRPPADAAVTMADASADRRRAPEDQGNPQGLRWSLMERTDPRPPWTPGGATPLK
ncbi:MAG: hypothetical protein U5R48_12375 [Gammaproteobacteria bacterium]|nr:hypothetical protein [Gammaproteobacteria bacterium]